MPPRADPGSPPRRIGVFIDGTWNAAASGARASETNVRRLYLATVEGLQHGVRQHRLYLQGVGRRPRPSWADAGPEALQRLLEREIGGATPALARRLMGGAFGRGTAARIRGAYQFISSLYRTGGDDRVYLFGFSRGAFAAQSLAGFIGRVGLLLADAATLPHVEAAYELYEFDDDPAQSRLGDLLQRLTGQRGVARDSPFFLPVHVLGLWDAVGALGLPGRMAWLSAPFTEHHQRHAPPSVMAVRHALALHELRRPFEPLLWQPVSGCDLQQRWFCGAHADVGGGYAPAESGRSEIALRWMAQEAQAAGLVLEPAEDWWTPRPPGPLHHEIRGPFLLARPTPRAWLTGLADPAGLAAHALDPSALAGLQAARPADHRFWRPGVNAALRQVDALGLRRAVPLALAEQAAALEARGASAPEARPPEAWWATLTADELAAAAATVADGLLPPGPQDPPSQQRFARALALRQLLQDPTALDQAADALAAGLPGLDRFHPTQAALDAAEHWLQHGPGQLEALAQVLPLLGTAVSCEQWVRVSKLKMDEITLPADCRYAREHLADLALLRQRRANVSGLRKA